MNSSYIKNVKEVCDRTIYELIDNDLTVDELMQDPEIKEIINGGFHWFIDDPETGKVSMFWVSVLRGVRLDQALNN